MAAFLRPSDIERIDLTSASVSTDKQTLYFKVVAPKEKRKGFHIIKPFLIHAHRTPSLCPVQAFIALRDHRVIRHRRPPQSLFVNSLRPSEPVKATTISTWLRGLIKLSTHEARVNVRSLASSLALKAGLPLEDIQTLGNWSNSATFQNHYRREHLALIDFTASVLPDSEAIFDYVEMDESTSFDSDDDNFVDAQSVLENVSVSE